MTFPPVLDVNWLALAPALTLLVTASIGVLFALGQRDSRHTALLALLGLALAAVFNLQLFQQNRFVGAETGFGLRYLADGPAVAFNMIVLLGTVLAVLVSFDYLRRSGLEQPEYYPLMLLSATGAMVMVAAGDLVTLLLGLEIMSLAVYVLAAWRQGARESEEAGMKYFLLGAFASAFVIYGIALLYGAGGSFVYGELAAGLVGAERGTVLLATLGGMFVLGGLGFKVAFVPFHQWLPDVYTGAPSSVTTYMSVVVKTAAFAGLLRVAVVVFPSLSPVLMVSLAWLVGLTMVVGNLSAYAQRGVKRMLAYSAVAHAGYLGLALLAAGGNGTRAAIWYLAAYTLMNAGAFAVLTQITDRYDHGDDLERFAGLGRQKPALALAMTLFLLSLAGIPPLAGFIGKILVFQAAIEAGYLTLAVVGIVSSVVAVVYYFRVIAYMYFREPAYTPPRVRSRAAGVAIAVAALGTVLLGLFPGWWYGLLGIGGQIVASS